MHNIINNKSLVLGLMSGTSMDGLDISCARYYYNNGSWSFELLACETFPYSADIKRELIKGFNKESSLLDLDQYFGEVLSNYVIRFLKKYNFNIDLISSHGHTIFHNPDNGYTNQIGLGSVIAKKTNIPVVSNFRQQDIDFGGQGAPLVPIGDYLLFSEYDSCLNLGGICNISFNLNEIRYAYDICPCNMVLNIICSKIGKDFDEDGNLAAMGFVNQTLLNELNQIDYYNLDIPKSLGKEYVEVYFLTIINASTLSVNDILATFVEHIAYQISFTFLKFKISNSLFTGGGSFNKYLINRVINLTDTKIIIPNNDIINFKEAIIFGFLGVLRLLNKANCLASATGASQDHSSGDIYLL